MRPTRVALLSHSEAFYTTRRLMEAGRALGLDMTRVDPIRCVVRCQLGRSWLEEDGREIPLPHAVIPRVGARIAGWTLTMLRAWVTAGVRSHASPEALASALDKMATTQLLAAAGLPVVPTVAVREVYHVDQALAAVGGAPVVLKLPDGSQGQGVTVARTTDAARSSLGMLVGLGHTVLVQPLLGPAGAARDLRVLVIDGRAAAACWREAAPGEFRSNVHCGGRVTPARLDDEPAELAAAAAAAVRLPTCGVDLLPVRGGVAIIEVNGSPGLEGIEGATGRDLASEMLRWLTA